MPGKAAKVIITERQQQLLDEFSRSRSEPFFLRQRSTLILLAFSGLLNEQIAPLVDLERHQVGIWRARWVEAFDRLILVECLEPPPALRQAIRDLLADAARPGSPGKFTAEQLAQIFAVACEPPEKSGRGTEQVNRASFERQGRATWASQRGWEHAARTGSAARHAGQSAE